MPTHEQTWSSKTYEENARFVSDLGNDVLAWLAPQPGENILDLGCGDGALTVRLIEAGATCIGVDTSEDFLASARARGLDVQLMNAENLSFDHEFDAVFTNAAMHWMKDQNAVMAGVARALRPGGRFVGEFGGHGNVAAIVTALRAVAAKYGLDDKLTHPWVYPTLDEHATRLAANGFRAEKLALIARPTPLKTGIRGWFATFRKPFFDQLPPGQREQALDDACEMLRWSLCDTKGRWTADYVRLRFAAVKL